jgi:ribonuclease D
VTPPALPAPRLIADPHTLQRLVDELQSQPRVAVDTESNSLFAYRERVCLIQFSTPNTDYLVDPLDLEDLSPLGSIFTSTATEKVFHAAEYDLICLGRDFGFTFSNLFDTRVASRTLGRPLDGLGDLLMQELGIRLDKRFQRANWGQRPLPAELLDYARLDTRYLLPLRDRLAAELAAAGRMQEASEECERLALTRPQPNGLDPQGFWRLTNARRLSPVQAGVLREIYLWREETARREDRPPFKVMGDKTLLALAERLPGSAADLEGVPGMSQGQIRRYAGAVLAAIRKGRKEAPPPPPVAEPVDEGVLTRHEAMRAWRKRAAERRGVESDVILPRDVMLEIARLGPTTLEELHRIMGPLHWRFQTYGAAILRELKH